MGGMLTQAISMNGHKIEMKTKSNKNINTHKWTFRPRFRRQAFGWRSQTPIKRIKEAVSEIKKVARKDKILAAEGAIIFLEKLSPAIEQVDSSSGAIGTAVNNAIDALVPIIVSAPADEKSRNEWLERLWDAIQDDDIPYLETLIDYWGELCVTPQQASRWADEFIGVVRQMWGPNSEGHGFFDGTIACLSALYTAGRYDELLELLDMSPYKMWHYRKWGAKALSQQGKNEEALKYAEDSRGQNEPDWDISKTCEEILLSIDKADDAYNRYAIEANRKSTYLASFRAISKKYPYKKPAIILQDLVDSTPGEEGKWFAAAKSVGLLKEAIELVNHAPCDPKTLTRAARNMAEKEPWFAIEAGLAALNWLAEGYGYEITSIDVLAAYDYTIKAAQNVGRKDEIMQRICEMNERFQSGDGFVAKVLRRHIDI